MVKGPFLCLLTPTIMKSGRARVDALHIGRIFTRRGAATELERKRGLRFPGG